LNGAPKEYCYELTKPFETSSLSLYNFDATHQLYSNTNHRMNFSEMSNIGANKQTDDLQTGGNAIANKAGDINKVNELVGGNTYPRTVPEVHSQAAQFIGQRENESNEPTGEKMDLPSLSDLAAPKEGNPHKLYSQTIDPHSTDVNLSAPRENPPARVP
jgi:hypothetical protein